MNLGGLIRLSSSTTNRPWPHKGAKLFVDGGKYHEFSHIGWGDALTQFAMYRAGYRSAADQLIKDAVRSKNISVLDVVFYPVCFSYRQYLELAMKFIFLQYSDKSREEKVKVIRSTGHSLLQLWNEIKPIFTQYAEPQGREDIEAAEEYIRQFHKIDASSFTFRYPIDKEIQKTIVAERRISLTNLRDRMTELDAFFIGIEYKLSEIAELKRDEAESVLSEIY